MAFLCGEQKVGRIMKNFNFDAPVMRFLTQVADLTMINVLWLVCCIPVFTIGAATTAMYRAVFAVHRSEGPLIQIFFTSFRLNLRQSTFLWIIELLIGSLIAGDLYLIKSGAVIETLPLLAAFCLSSFFFLFTVTYLFPMVAYYSNTSRNMILNAFLLSLKNLPQTILMCILNIAPFALFFLSSSLFLKVGFIWLLFGFSGTAYCNSIFLLRIFHTVAKATENSQ